VSDHVVVPRDYASAYPYAPSGKMWISDDAPFLEAMSTLLAVSAVQMFSGRPLTPLSQPLPFFAYPFFAATLVGWAWVNYKAPVDNEARHGHLKSCRAPQPLSARARRWSAGMQGTRCASASPSMMLSDTRFVASL